MVTISSLKADSSSFNDAPNSTPSLWSIFWVWVCMLVLTNPAANIKFLLILKIPEIFGVSILTYPRSTLFYLDLGSLFSTHFTLQGGHSSNCGITLSSRQLGMPLNHDQHFSGTTSARWTYSQSGSTYSWPARRQLSAAAIAKSCEVMSTRETTISYSCCIAWIGDLNLPGQMFLHSAFTFTLDLVGLLCRQEGYH